MITNRKHTILSAVLLLLLCLSACNPITSPVPNEVPGNDSDDSIGAATSMLISNELEENENSTLLFNHISFDPDPIISTVSELENKSLPTLDQLYNYADELNNLGDFGYRITREPDLPESLNYEPDRAAAIRIEDPESNISANILFYQTYCFGKTIYFEAPPEQSVQANKMLWFARYLFGNLPDGAFNDFENNAQDSRSQKFLYKNGDIMYRYYLSSYPLTIYDTNKTSVHYTLSHCYNSIEQYKDFFEDAVPANITELSNQFEGKRVLKVVASAGEIKPHESEEYYEANLHDENGNSVQCRLDNIRTKDTVGDIKKATLFFGSMMGDYYNVSFYY